jgi:hypothetical protein
MRSLIGMALLGLACVTQAEEIKGKVVSITDGDTLIVLDSEKVQHKIRMVGIDAPEKAQPVGAKSKDALGDKVFGKEVIVETDKKDRYGRTLGKISARRWSRKEWLGTTHHFSNHLNMRRLKTQPRQRKKASGSIKIRSHLGNGESGLRIKRNNNETEFLMHNQKVK